MVIVLTYGTIAAIAAEPGDLCELEWEHGTESLLDDFYDCRACGRFCPAVVVGAGCDHPYWRGLLVAGLSQRLVLIVAAQ